MKRKIKQNQNSSLFYDLYLLLGYLNRQRKWQLFFLLGLMALSSLSEIVSLGAVLPFLSALSNASRILTSTQWQSLLAMFSIETSTQLVTWLALMFIAAVIMANGLRILTINVRTHLAASISSDLSCQLYDRMLLQPYGFYLQHNSSDLMQMLIGDARALAGSILIPLLALITNSFVIAALVGGLCLVNVRVAIMAASVLGSAYLGLYRLRRNLLKHNSQVMVQNAKQQIKIVQEGLGGIRDVLLGGTQRFFQSVYQQADRSYRNATASNTVISQTPRYLIEFLTMTGVALFALSLGRNGDFSQTVPVLGTFALGTNRLLPALQQSFAALAKIQGKRASLHRVLTGLQRPVDPLQAWVTSVGLPLEDELRFEDVWFRYSDEAGWVLQDLNLRIKSRTTVGFVGSTGSGKSTTADLLLGLLKPQRGTIWVDGRPLEGERLRQWQQSISHVPQSIFLADATIAENIAFGISKEQIDFAQVCKAARLAQIEQCIQELPAQYETYVGERGVRLSGGQRQRIGIARALYRQASVIVFDEATSALDNATERDVMAAINGLSRQLTIILIAHRLSTVERCDLVVELSQGRVVAQGSYQELLERSASFKRMAIL